MPRIKKISTEELLRFVNEYCIKNAGTKITIPKLGQFIRDNGYDVGDYLLRRDSAVRMHMQKYNQTLIRESDCLVIVYHGLDIDSFLEQNRTKNQLRDALLVRDSYYASITAKAAIIQEKNQKLKRENETLRLENEQMRDELEKRQSEQRAERDIAFALKAKDEIIKNLRAIIFDQVYPETANYLLQKEGIFDGINKVVIPENIEKMCISADTDIYSLRYSSTMELLKGCDE